MPQTLFTNVSIIDGSGAEPYAGQVLVQGNRIKSVAGLDRKLEHDGAQVVDAGGATLMPGLVEAHAHPSFANTATLDGLGDIPPEEHVLICLRHARILLDQGFTSILSAAAAKPRLDIVLRNAINSGEFPGPRMLAASPELTVTGGLGDVRLSHLHRETFAVICDGPDEFRKMARVMVREGVDTLKVNPAGDALVPFASAYETVMNDQEMAAVREVADSRGKRMAAHARSDESVRMCIRHRVEIIYHAMLCSEETIDQLTSVKDKVFVAPTIGATYATLYEAGPFGLSQEVCESLGIKQELDFGIGVMKELKRRGVRILPGGDYGFAWTPMGTNARDIEHFVKLLDFTPLEAIRSATQWGGEIMMRGHELGLIKEGYLADILLVDGNPAQDVSILQDKNRLIAIMKDGTFHKAPPAEAVANRIAAE
ncbi:MAG: amidohydrolase family protein [Alphaproteobacteria bacterium]